MCYGIPLFYQTPIIIFKINYYSLIIFYYLCNCISTAEARYGLSGWVCRHKLKSVYLRSFLALRNLENFNHSQEWCNSRCLCGYVYFGEFRCESIVRWSYTIFCVRLLCCSFNCDGQSRASECETSNKYGSHAFLFF